MTHSMTTITAEAYTYSVYKLINADGWGIPMINKAMTIRQNIVEGKEYNAKMNEKNVTYTEKVKGAVKGIIFFPSDIDPTNLGKYKSFSLRLTNGRMIMDMSDTINYTTHFTEVIKSVMKNL